MKSIIIMLILAISISAQIHQTDTIEVVRDTVYIERSAAPEDAGFLINSQWIMFGLNVFLVYLNLR